jgi:hypothetical protein
VLLGILSYSCDERVLLDTILNDNNIKLAAITGTLGSDE